jgi:hypothetical protein
MELVEVELPAGAEVFYPPTPMPTSTSKFGCSTVVCGAARATRKYELDARDCLQLGRPAPCSFINPTSETCRYLVALTKRQP